jgi:hypothetical protein
MIFMVVVITLSTNAKWATFSGTYQEVIDALADKGIPESKVRGFAFVSAGNCIALVHKH